MNSSGANEQILFALALLALIILLFPLAEYFTRRARYLWKVRHDHNRLLPKFNAATNPFARSSSRS